MPPVPAQVVRGVLVAVLVLAYPFLIYLLLTHGLPWLGSLLVLGLVTWKIRARADWLWWLAALAVSALLVAALFGPGALAKLAPLPIHAGLLYLFLHSLRTTPLIEQFARLDFPELPPEIKTYTRHLTRLWAGFFAFNLLLVTWLALWGEDSTWALYNGLIVYLLIGGLVLGEYLWRHVRFPHLEIPSLLQTTHNIVRNGHRIWNPERHEGLD